MYSGKVLYPDFGRNKRMPCGDGAGCGGMGESSLNDDNYAGMAGLRLRQLGITPANVLCMLAKTSIDNPGKAG